MIDLGARELALASLLLLGHGVASALLGLGLGKRLLLAGLRAALQLFLLGLVLERVFASDSPVLVIGLAVAMALVAGHESIRRARHRVRGGFFVGSAAMLCSAIVVTLYTAAVVLRAEPFWDPRVWLPITGMLLGNALNGVALGYDALLSGLVEQRARVELLLACGATRAEATRDVVRQAVRTGLVPILNSLVAAGVIAIPGMMTGQILAGEDPEKAARYQLMILLCIAGAVALGTTLAVFLGLRSVFDERDRLRLERIRER